MRRALHLAALLTPLALVACADTYDDGHGELYDDHLHEADGPIDLKAAGLTTVADVVRARGCSTAPLRALDEQIARELACLAPETMRRIDDIPGLTLGGGARTFLQAGAADALRAAVGRAGPMTLNSGWRSVAQQHVLKSWEGSCGIGIAAEPGRSNHQSGLALDVADWGTSGKRNALKDAGFSWYCDYRNGGRSSGCRDVVHFDFFGGADLRPYAVLAFQRLWNRNNPGDRIAEDGDWGPQTAARVNRSPLEGFAEAASCGATGEPAPEPQPEEEAQPEPAPEADPAPGDEPIPPKSRNEGICDDPDQPLSEHGERCTDFDEGFWRCSCNARLERVVSQVCRGGQWVNFHADPADCGRCYGEYTDGCNVDGTPPPEPAPEADPAPDASLNGGVCADPGLELSDHAWRCDGVPNNTWRCACSETHETTVSQVCRDGRWINYQLDPRDCGACDGGYSSGCEG